MSKRTHWLVKSNSDIFWITRGEYTEEELECILFGDHTIPIARVSDPMNNFHTDLRDIEAGNDS